MLEKPIKSKSSEVAVKQFSPLLFTLLCESIGERLELNPAPLISLSWSHCDIQQDY